MQCECLKVGEDYERSIVHRHCRYWRAGSNWEVRHYYFTAGEIIIFIISKSYVDFNGLQNNRLINQSKYLERVTAQRYEIQAYK